MAKILIDSNVFIDLLALSAVQVQAFFDELIKNKTHVIFPQQVVDEVLRNSPEKIANTSQNLEKDLPKINGKTFKCLDVGEEVKQINSNLTLLRKKINTDKDKKEKNVLTFFKEKTKHFILLPTSAKIIRAARLRKEKGNPPSSGTSIGDEIIWESVLAWGKDDIVIFTRDKTWIEHKGFLEYEYESKNNKKILAFERELSKAYELLNLEESKRLKEIENAERKQFALENLRFFENIGVGDQLQKMIEEVTAPMRAVWENMTVQTQSWQKAMEKISATTHIIKAMEKISVTTPIIGEDTLRYKPPHLS